MSLAEFLNQLERKLGDTVNTVVAIDRIYITCNGKRITVNPSELSDDEIATARLQLAYSVLR